MAKFDPFLSLDCARVEGVGVQSKFCYLATRISTTCPYEQGGDREDDYTVIQVLQDLTEPVVINTYEADFANEFLVQTHHHVNGLDGKVSRVEVFVL